MSITKSVGRCTLFALVVYLFVKGALIVVPRTMVGAVSGLVAALVHACCGTDGSASMRQEEPAAVLVMASSPIHDSKPSVARGTRVRPEGAVKNVPSQDQSFE